MAIHSTPVNLTIFSTVSYKHGFLSHSFHRRATTTTSGDSSGGSESHYIRWPTNAVVWDCDIGNFNLSRHCTELSREPLHRHFHHHCVCHFESFWVFTSICMVGAPWSFYYYFLLDESLSRALSWCLELPYGSTSSKIYVGSVIMFCCCLMRFNSQLITSVIIFHSRVCRRRGCHRGKRTWHWSFKHFCVVRKVAVLPRLTTKSCWS